MSARKTCAAARVRPPGRAVWLGVKRLVPVRARRLLYLRDRHVWYARDIPIDPAGHVLPAGLRMVRAGAAELPLLDQLPRRPAPDGVVDPERARQRVAEGNELWLVLGDSGPVYAVWHFPSRVPALAAREASIRLPPGTACIDDSVTHPAFRRQGIAAAADIALLNRIAEQGTHTVLTQTHHANEAVRQGLASFGFREVATVDFLRIGWRRRVRVQADSTGVGAYLAAELRR